MVINFVMHNNNSIMRPFLIGSNLVERVTNYKLLGVQLSEDLKWNKHVDYIYKKLVRSYIPTSFPGLQCEDEARHEEALVWAGHVTTKNGSI